VPLRPGRLDPLEIKEALEAFSESASAEDLEAALDRVPALSSPWLHTYLREEYVRLATSETPKLPEFAERYWMLFFLLHMRWHVEIARWVREEHRMAASPGRAAEPNDGFLPPFWAALRDSLGDLVPDPVGPVRVPALDADGLRDDLRLLVGRNDSLPVYEPTIGMSWVAVIVECAACGRRRVDVRAYMVDLVVAPYLLEPLRRGLLNGYSCPACDETCAIPVGVWAMEQPGPEDPLALLSCVWRLAPDVFCYQPPAGTARVMSRDVILEVRFDEIFQALEWPVPVDRSARSSPIQRIISIAYTPSELLHYVDRLRVKSSNVPLAMESFVAEMSRRVESRLTPLHLLMNAVEELIPRIGQEWPLPLMEAPDQWRDSPIAHLVCCLIAEGLARARSETPGSKAVLAALTASSLIAMGEDGLAESALERAEDCLAEMPEGDDRERAYVAVLDVRADLLQSLRRYEDANLLRHQVLHLYEPHLSDSATGRLAAMSLASQQALGLFNEGKLAEALIAFDRCIADLRAMLDELDSDEDQEIVGITANRLKHLLSGNLANLGMMLRIVADDVTLVMKLNEPSLSDDDRVNLIRAADPNRAASEARAVRLEAAGPILSRFGGDTTELSRLRKEAERLLREALPLSTATKSWEFAGIQAHHLMGLRRDAGDAETAHEFAELAVRYAGIAGDHERAAGALAFLAQRELELGDGPAALQYLEEQSVHDIRFKVGLGHNPELIPIGTVAETAFRAVAVGADPLRAIMLIESLRAAHTAVSLSLGTPYQLVGSAVPTALAELLTRREQIRILKTQNQGNAETQKRLRDIEVELSRVRSKLALRDPRFARWVDATDLDLAAPESMIRRLAQLGQGSLWFGTLATRASFWAWTVDTAGVASVTSRPIPEHWYGDYPESAVEDEPWFNVLLAELSNALLAPHAERINALNSTATLVISVSGSLEKVSFAAMPWAGKRLCNCADIVTVQGFGMFEAALSRPAIDFNSFALIGAPVRQDLSPMPGAEKELAAIADLLTTAHRDVSIASGAAATAAALVEAAPSHDVIHIACDATGRVSTAPAELKLSPDRMRRDSGDVSEDRISTGITVRQGALIDIAGCSTGRTWDSGGPLLDGLIPAFLLAGAGCVIASLWPIEDEPSARFQLEFYRNLISGARPASALAAAQRSCARGDLGGEMCSALIWASYVAYGGW
jgi:tetratricopeptide (TPR) repeat protein